VEFTLSEVNLLRMTSEGTIMTSEGLEMTKSALFFSENYLAESII